MKRRGFLATLCALPWIRELPAVRRWRNRAAATPENVWRQAFMYGTAMVDVATMTIVDFDEHETRDRYAVFSSPLTGLEDFHGPGIGALLDKYNR